MDAAEVGAVARRWTTAVAGAVGAMIVALFVYVTGFDVVGTIVVATGMVLFAVVGGLCVGWGVTITARFRQNARSSHP